MRREIYFYVTFEHNKLPTWRDQISLLLEVNYNRISNVKVLRNWATLSDIIRLPFSYFTPFQNYLWQKVGIDWLDSGSSEDQRIPAKGLFSESYPPDLRAPGSSEHWGPVTDVFYLHQPHQRHHIMFKIKYISVTTSVWS